MWDYLIVTAGNEAQAAAYRMLLEERRALGLIPDVDKVLVVPDAKGKRIGSGGSTILCLLAVLNSEEKTLRASLPQNSCHPERSEGSDPKGRPESFEGSRSASPRSNEILRSAQDDTGDETATPQKRLAMTRSLFSRLRILIVHAGGDSRRLPAYGPCGKIFVPIPGESDQAVPLTIFDRLLPTYLALPPNTAGKGQVVVASGDVLLFFDSSKVKFDRESKDEPSARHSPVASIHGRVRRKWSPGQSPGLRPPGIIGLGAYAAPETAKNHGVFCAGPDGRVRTYLQKPSVDEQAAQGAIDQAGQSVLDIGVFSLDGPATARLLALCGPVRTKAGRWTWSGDLVTAIEEFGLDFYREITTAMGTETRWNDYARSVRRAGSRLPDRYLRKIHRVLAGTPFFVSLLPRCDFLHFGTSHQLIAGGNALEGAGHGPARHRSCLDINNAITGEGKLIGTDSWVEGCRIRAALTLGGENVVAGADVDEPISLPAKTVLDIVKGKNRRGKAVWFVRCYGIDDGLGQAEAEGATAAGAPGFAVLIRERMRAGIARGSTSAVLAREYKPRASGEPKARPLTMLNRPAGGGRLGREHQSPGPDDLEWPVLSRRRSYNPPTSPFRKGGGE